MAYVMIFTSACNHTISLSIIARCIKVVEFAWKKYYGFFSHKVRFQRTENLCLTSENSFAIMSTRGTKPVVVSGEHDSRVKRTY